MPSQYLQVGTTAVLGDFAKGDTLDFTLSGLSLSQDSEHFKAYTLKGFEDWVIVGVEDDSTKWSDWDYNDTVFAIKLGDTADIPEPSTIIGLLGVGAAGLFIRRKSLTK
ncbi:MAG: PEP-CTERM sorting domain-containing protein [Okeania sp. SIO2H7]|nr:PEP-CTERM sorting domain-containing protein [Okeania sp. SIO2H7]